MAKKQETVEPKTFCQECKFRQHGAEARRTGQSGYCEKRFRYVARKEEACDRFQRRRPQ